MNKKSMKHVMMALLLCFALIFACGVETSAATAKEKKAYKAYYNAIKNNKTIKHSKDEWNNMMYYMADIDGDGIKELCLYSYYGTPLTVYGYKKGAVKKLAKGIDPEYVYYYQSSKKCFWMVGEGDGGWCICYKKSGSKLKETLRYSCEYSYSDGKFHYYKKEAGKKRVTISKSTYEKQCNKVESYKSFKDTNKTKLMNKLKSLY